MMSLKCTPIWDGYRRGRGARSPESGVTENQNLTTEARDTENSKIGNQSGPLIDTDNTDRKLLLFGMLWDGSA
jgi:hypothetical protein